jgi:two-component system, cell cycle sensor histidine kinase and response regulator CckA
MIPNKVQERWMKEKIRILMLEDNPGDAGLAKSCLEDAKLSVHFKRVETEKEFISEIRNHVPDLVLSDFRLPDFDGMRALAYVRENAPDIPFIILTGAINEETAVACMKAGATDYILKDRLSRLPQAVMAAFEKQKVLDKQKTIEEALLVSEMRYRRLFESAQEGILLIDVGNKKITDVNPAVLQMLSFERNAIIGKELWEVGIFQDQNAFQKAFERLETEGRVNCEGMVLNTGYNEHLNIDMNCNSFFMDERWVIQCNIRDITERKRAEEEQERMRSQLFQAQKMEAIGTLAGGVAHDFNNLMTAIQVSTDVAMMKAEDGDTITHELEEVRNAALRASGLIRPLLLFSRKHLMEFTAVNLNRVIENLLKMLHRLIGEDIEIKMMLSPDVKTIRADSGNLEQVIMNLTLNARDAMPKGGQLIIKTENLNFDANIQHQMPEAYSGQFVCLTVTDTGIGMNPDTLSRMFEPFFTTKGSQKGTGLGLSVVYGIVKQHEGWIVVDSAPDKGAVFKIFFPVAGEEAEFDDNEHIPIDGLHGSGERILLVEDEDKVREFTTRAIKKCGYEVFPTRSVKEALEVYKSENGRFDLVFSDVVLSDRTGIDLADELIKQKSDIKILLCSGYMDHKSQWPLIRKKGYAFLQKPYALPELLQAIRDAVQS